MAVTKKETEVKKDTKAKKTTRKPKEVEIVDVIKDDIEEIEVEEVEEVKPKKTYRELRAEFRNKKNDIEVEILNLNSCATSCRARDGRLIFRLERTGDREFVTLADIFEVANRHKGMFDRHWISIIDVDSDEYSIEDVLTYLNLDEVYENNEIENYDTDYIGQILKMDVRKFERMIESASDELVKMVASRAVELYRQKKFDSRIKEEILANRLHREDLFDM